jgi:hypothetical protein
MTIHRTWIFILALVVHQKPLSAEDVTCGRFGLKCHGGTRCILALYDGRCGADSLVNEYQCESTDQPASVYALPPVASIPVPVVIGRPYSTEREETGHWREVAAKHEVCLFDEECGYHGYCKCGVGNGSPYPWIGICGYSQEEYQRRLGQMDTFAKEAKSDVEVARWQFLRDLLLKRDRRLSPRHRK